MTGIAAALWFTNKPEDARSTFLVGLIIAAVGMASIIYDFDNWSLGKRIGIHFLVMCATVLPVLVFSGWFPTNSLLDYLAIFGIFVATGLGILVVIGVGLWINRLAKRRKVRHAGLDGDVT